MKEKIKQPEGGLLQSKEWANALRAENKNIIEIHDNDNVFFGVEQILAIVGKYIYFPRCYQITENLIQKFLQLNYGWIRIDVYNKQELNMLIASGKKVVKAPHNTQPKENLIIDITKSEEELLAQMKGKTRYNIRLAKKKGVKIFHTREKKYIDIFCDLVEATANRKGITFHSREHYQKMFDNISSDVLQLYVAQYDDKIIAINIVSFYGGVATYLHGATSDEHRNTMAPFLLQWQAIKDAKAKEYHWYDFGGVFSKSNDNGKKGITRFKRGFAPHVDFFLTQGSYDIIFSRKKYYLYRFLQKWK